MSNNEEIEEKFVYEVVQTANLEEFDLDSLQLDLTGINEPSAEDQESNRKGSGKSPTLRRKSSLSPGRPKYFHTESVPTSIKNSRYTHSESINATDERKPIVVRKQKVKSKFSRIFSNPSLATMSHENSLVSLTSQQRRDNTTTPRESDFDTHEGSRLLLSKSTTATIRQTRMTPAYNPGRDVMAKSEGNHVNTQLPMNYVDPYGKYPAKEAYIQSIKTQVSLYYIYL